MKKLITLCFLIAASMAMHAQTEVLTTTVRGTVVDKQSQYPIPGAVIVLKDSNPVKGTTSDLDGNFRLEGVPVGRITIEVNMVGYEPSTHPNLLVNSGKEFELNVQLTESVASTGTVEILADQNKGEVNNKMSTVSTRTMNIEEARRYSGTLQDVARMAQNYAGVSNASDDRNDIIIRGNSPTGVLWRLEGIDIPNPNHFATLATTGGPISLINTNNLANSDFSTGAFAAEYGNALSGVFDLKLRSGNKDKHEFIGQIGFNGFEFGAEGPLKKGGQASYMVNGRYSFLGIMTSLGIDFGTGAAVPEYQDLTFKFDLPTKKAGKFTVFGIGGNSFIDFKAEESEETGVYASDNENQQFHSTTGVAGITHSYFFNEKTSGKLVLAATTGGTEGFIDTLDVNDVATRFFGILQRQNELKGTYTINSKLNARHTIRTGVMYNYYQFNVEDSVLYQGGYYFKERDYQGNTALARVFGQWQYRPSEQWTLNTGLYTQNFAYNNRSTIEPRIGAKYAMNETQSFSFGAGLHSQLQPIVVYFNKEENQQGQIVANNKDLDFNKAIHGVLGYENMLAKNLRLKAEVYYQYLYDIAVDQTSSSFSMLNVGADFVIPNNANLANDGLGENYGVEITLEKFLDKGFYFLFTTSLFDSKYTGSDNVERNTAFNGNYVFNLLAGKEWKVGKNNAFTADFKTTYAGGRWYSPVLLEQSIASGEEIRDEAHAFSEQYTPYFRTDFKLGFRMNRAKYAQAFYFDVRNITNQQNVFSQSFNNRSERIETIYQTGFFPIFLYNVWF
ncbi:MAG: carboxypeptidase regulatory-like domain-containing protein [Flavobacteriales bacterium]